METHGMLYLAHADFFTILSWGTWQAERWRSGKFTMSFFFAFIPSSARFAAGGRRNWFKRTLVVARDLIYNSNSCIGYVFLLCGPEKWTVGKEHVLHQYSRLTSQIIVAGTSEHSSVLPRPKDQCANQTD